MHDDTGDTLRIGAIATDAGLTPDTVRYYERLGLVPRPARTDGGFRVYPSDTIERLRFIKQAQTLGLGLKEIRELLRPANGRRREQCQKVRGVLTKHLADLDARMRELDAFRQTLHAAVEECDRALRHQETIACPVLNHLGGGKT